MSNKIKTETKICPKCGKPMSDIGMEYWCKFCFTSESKYTHRKNMGILVISHNMKDYFTLHNDIIRINSPWYTYEELVDTLKNEKCLKFLDINIKTRNKPKRSNIDYNVLLKLANKYKVEWVGISNVEKPETYDKVMQVLDNRYTKVCAKIETEMGCWHADHIISRFDGIMVDTEDLAFDLGWTRAVEEKDRIYALCRKSNVPHFRLLGSIFKFVN